jgi:hypothetical protein
MSAPRLLISSLDEALALRVTLLVLLVRPPDDGWLRGGMWLIAGAALAVPPLLHLPSMWLALAVLMAARLVVEFPLADNHLYLLAYWCLAIGLAQLTADRTGTLARSARWLVGATFACAVVWKLVLAPDFLDARFFLVTLLTDNRFAVLARAVGRLSDAQLAENRDALTPIDPGLEVVGGPVLTEPAPLRALGGALTWGGLGLEALLAAAFLLPARSRGPGRTMSRTRHVLLIAFCVVTYAVAPVGGFGWLLAAMGMAQATTVGQRAAYVAVCALVVVYAETPLVPWTLSLATP